MKRIISLFLIYLDLTKHLVGDYNGIENLMNTGNSHRYRLYFYQNYLIFSFFLYKIVILVLGQYNLKKIEEINKIVQNINYSSQKLGVNYCYCFCEEVLVWKLEMGLDWFNLSAESRISVRSANYLSLLFASPSAITLWR